MGSSCDGRPGDDGRERCAEYIDAGTQRRSNAPSPAGADDDLRRAGNSFSGGPLGSEPIQPFPGAHG